MAKLKGSRGPPSLPIPVQNGDKTSDRSNSEELTHSEAFVWSNLLEGEDILRSLSDGRGRSCPVSCQVWECRSRKIKVVARNNSKPERYAPCQWEARWTTTCLWKAWCPHTSAWDCVARKGQEIEYWTCPSFSEQRAQSSQRPWIGHHRLGLGFSASSATYHWVLHLRTRSGLLFSTSSFLTENCNYWLGYSPKTALFLLLEGLYRGGETWVEF